MKTIDDFDLTDISFALKPGIYILAQGDEAVYIGMSIRPIQRIADHVGLMVFDSIYVVSCDINELATLESEFIRKYQPKYNIRFPNHPVDNLAPEAPRKEQKQVRLFRLSRRLRETDIEELARLIHVSDGTIEDEDSEP
jgi:hypothetical protein